MEEESFYTMKPMELRPERLKQKIFGFNCTASTSGQVQFTLGDHKTRNLLPKQLKHLVNQVHNQGTTYT